METFKAETMCILNRFLDHHISFPEYIAATDATFASVMPRMKGQNIAALRAVMLTNHDAAMAEMARRGEA